MKVTVNRILSKKSRSKEGSFLKHAHNLNKFLQKRSVWVNTIHGKYIYTGFPHILKNYFPHFFNTKLKDFNTIT